MKKRKHWEVWIIVVLYVAWIFHNSMMIASASAIASGKVANKLITIVNRYGFYIDYNLFHYYVRKLAHFTEYAGLGFLVSIAMNICPLFRSRFLNFILFLLVIPFTDETIQKFVAGRSSQVFDMAIDGSGILFGGLIGYILILIVRDLTGKKNR